MIYIGFHATFNLNDKYMGSGREICKAIKEFGVENFKKEILFIFDNKEEMVSKEAEIVNVEFRNRKDTYNVALGGGCWGTLGTKISDEMKRRISEKLKLKPPISEETREKLRIAQSKRKIRKPHTKESRDKISIAAKGRKKPTRTKEHCENLSKANKGKSPPRERVERVMASKKGKKYPLAAEHLKQMSENNRGKKHSKERIEKVRMTKVINKINSLLFGVIISKQNGDSK